MFDFQKCILPFLKVLRLILPPPPRRILGLILTVLSSLIVIQDFQSKRSSCFSFETGLVDNHANTKLNTSIKSCKLPQPPFSTVTSCKNPTKTPLMQNKSKPKVLRYVYAAISKKAVIISSQYWKRKELWGSSSTNSLLLLASTLQNVECSLYDATAIQYDYDNVFRNGCRQLKIMHNCRNLKF